MGSEHSTQATQGQGNFHKQKQPNVRRQQTIANPGAAAIEPSDQDHKTYQDNGRPGSISPGPSLCSDVDLPYISYTVNRPIGDSPKLTNKQLVKTKSTKKVQQMRQPKSRATHNIVVVRSANPPTAAAERDPDVVRLQGIPMFLPIMRATLSLPAARDPEILERLDPTPLRNLCLRYQHHLTSAANLVAAEQNQLTQKVRETDMAISRIIAVSTEKQKKFARYAEKFSKVQELSHQLNRCHMLLNQLLESMETLNNYLDIEDRLEPFVWTTG